MSSVFKKGVESSHKTTKSYSFKKDTVTLSFQLNLDVQKEMRDFVSLLKLAVEEVEQDLAKE